MRGAATGRPNQSARRWWKPARLAALLLLIPCLPASSGGQPLRIERRLTLGDDESAVLGSPIAVVRDRHGRFVVASWEIPGELAVFDQTGRYLRSVGRKGRGPGEYGYIVDLAVQGGNLHVFDAQLRRETVLDSAFQVIETRRLTGNVLSAIVLDGGTTVVNADLRTREMIGVPFHVLDPQGKPLRSFGADSLGYRRGLPWLGYRVLTPAKHAGFWSAYKNQYVIQRWTADGRLLATFTRQSEEFTPYFDEVPPAPWSAPQPVIRAIREDSLGRLWVAAAIGDPEWGEGLREVDRPAHGHTHVISDHNRYYDTVLELLREDGTLLASTRIDDVIREFLGDGLFVTYTDSGGIPSLTVWQAHPPTGR